MKNKSEIYYVQDLEIQFRGAILYVDAKVYKDSYLYGEDAEYNRGEWRVDREVEVEEVRNEYGEQVIITDLLQEVIADKIIEKGNLY